MKNKVIIAAMVSAFVAIPAAQATNLTDHTTVTWDISAKKTSTATLAVEAANDGEVSFSFDPTTNQFGEEESFINVMVHGDGSATAFKLVATLGDKTLTHDNGASVSTLTVGMLYNVYDTTTPVFGSSFTLLDSTIPRSVTSDAMKALINGVNPRYKRNTTSTGNDLLYFKVVSGNANNTAVTDLSKLPNGNWSGNLTVNFTATWTVPV